MYCEKQISCLIVKLQILHCAAFCYGWLVLQSTLLLMQFSNVFLALPLLQKNRPRDCTVQSASAYTPEVEVAWNIFFSSGAFYQWCIYIFSKYYSYILSKFVQMGVLEVTQPCNDRKTLLLMQFSNVFLALPMLQKNRPRDCTIHSASAYL